MEDWLDKFPDSCKDSQGNLFRKCASVTVEDGKDIINGVICSIPNCPAFIRDNEIVCRACDYMDAAMKD